MIFLLDVFLTALLTEGFFFSLIISIFAVLSVDYIFTPPYWNVSFTLSGFPLTFLVTMTISVVTGIVTSRAKQMDEVRREAELERMHGNLLRAVSHDIRTPLTGIVGATNVLLEQENTLTPEQRHELIRNANEEAQWLIRIVENLLSITRMGGDEAKVNKTPEAAEEIIEGAVGKFTRRWGTDIPVEVRLPEEFLLVPMDPLLMEQVLTNLMENAVLHGKTTRHITVTLCRSGDWTTDRASPRTGWSISLTAPCRVSREIGAAAWASACPFAGRWCGLTAVTSGAKTDRRAAHDSPWSCLWIKKFNRR